MMSRDNSGTIGDISREFTRNAYTINIYLEPKKV